MTKKNKASQVEASSVPLTDHEKAIVALESTFNLICEGSFPISKFDQIKASLSFLETLHKQMAVKVEEVTNE